MKFLKMSFVAEIQNSLCQLTLEAEMKLLTKNIGSGIYVRESNASKLAWDVVVFVRDGYYQGAICKIRILIPSDYPTTTAPRLIFSPAIFHPSVNPITGELDITR